MIMVDNNACLNIFSLFVFKASFFLQIDQNNEKYFWPNEFRSAFCSEYIRCRAENSIFC